MIRRPALLATLALALALALLAPAAVPAAAPSTGAYQVELIIFKLAEAPASDWINASSAARTDAGP